MGQVGGHTLVQPHQAFVPQGLFDAIDGTRVSGILILQSSANNLIRVGSHCRDQLRNGSEEQIFTRTLENDQDRFVIGKFY